MEIIRRQKNSHKHICCIIVELFALCSCNSADTLLQQREDKFHTNVLHLHFLSAGHARRLLVHIINSIVTFVVAVVVTAGKCKDLPTVLLLPLEMLRHQVGEVLVKNWCCSHTA
ncbi:unnamed protein product [Ceratitis capitata]|uniref:(Mediterranean fruit fly) hypothetical protein n=1 Tax=Ceratitis capitata TaxID=7213 RepID=A0A811TXS9_CERCA|nr:unnamed protein product [Ceratitis capitata]